MGHDIYAVDAGYVRPGLAASHLIVSGERAAFIDTGTANSIPRLLGALNYLGLSPECVSHVLLTHIHLDHAGGAGQLMQSLPEATLFVHPRGARHMTDPAKLIQGTRAVYGDAEYRRLYGEIVPVAGERVHEVADGEVTSVGVRELKLLHTRGHANHHYSIVDPAAKAIFSGDSFGVSYRELDTDNGEFIIPTTTPVHFDPEAAHASIDLMLSFEPEAIFLTHYSKVTSIARLAKDLHADIDAFVAIAEGCEDREDRMQNIADGMRDYVWQRLSEHGYRGGDRQREDVLGMDIELNSMGLDVWLSRMTAA
ncbi:MAG: MBL fold metallo-hydrolase [Gammaproteobacteria bacterium]|nr:MBL fold metallo-hydrolase [Gammaproteobacteria bacterium]